MSRSSGSRWIGEFLRSFAQALLRSTSSKPGERAGDRETGARRPTARTGAGRVADGIRDDRIGTGFDASPGRDGSSATRDLAPSEIRTLRPSYDPAPDGDPDPGEVVWTWVPYVENDGRGKDRPVLIIARIDATSTAGCYLSTKEHRGFVPVGSGGWDGQGRESFLAPDRVLRVSHDGMRREGHVLPQERFSRAVDAVARLHGIG